LHLKLPRPIAFDNSHDIADLCRFTRSLELKKRRKIEDTPSRPEQTVDLPLFFRRNEENRRHSFTSEEPQ
jgi:hypothetical protein